ncbi:signal peptidase I [Paenibacillus sp. N3.4]|uniref:signal peptidase I n=1 Tax=Paenibacillus sp. N3.4 TaxID=2603222 RepID=UPI0011C9DBC0|nr:signal peptidase I [Paenibacillus sp. N3.4]TXK74615.1 signal peptidase I [Paenibacillus sp. N3.4]
MMQNMFLKVAISNLMQLKNEAYNEFEGGLVMRYTMLISIFFILFIFGCEEQKLIDYITQESPATVEKKQDFILFENNNDGMSRRNQEYDSQKKGKLVVDPNYYTQNEFKRGEVVYYKTPAIDKKKYPRLNPSEHNISRVIALPGEVVQIKKGQVQVNGKKLNTFYGKALSWGLDEEEYFHSINQPGTAVCDDLCQKTMKNYFNMDMDKFKVPDNHLFVMGDTWWRSIDSQFYGPLPMDLVTGKVLGYEEK